MAPYQQGASIYFSLLPMHSVPNLSRVAFTGSSPAAYKKLTCLRKLMTASHHNPVHPPRAGKVGGSLVAEETPAEALLRAKGKSSEAQQNYGFPSCQRVPKTDAAAGATWAIGAHMPQPCVHSGRQCGGDRSPCPQLAATHAPHTSTQ